jgi:type I restriction enzyme S subunit
MSTIKDKGYIDVLCNKSTIAHFTAEKVAAVPVPLPPSSEQTQIAAFLDRETEKIDGLVAEQRRLMELLKEKRQAVISHAVTRGLNPDAPMKPSGIEWLGDVPAHWDAAPLKFLAKIGNGSTPSREIPEYWAETGFPWLNSSVVNSKVVTEPEGFVTTRALRECHLPIVVPPAILVGITGQGRTRGMSAMLGIEATINQHVAYVKPSSVCLDVNYLLRIFESAYLKLRRDSEETGATKGAITCGQIGELRIPVPPLAEQNAIVVFLESESSKFDTLTTEAHRTIDLLQERRTALISAAVTGQIDVRSAV